MTLIASLYPHPMNLEKSCLEKSRYPTEVNARRHAQSSLQKRGEHPRLWVYPCINCKGWHITSKPGGTAAATAVTKRQLYEGFDL